MFIAILLGMLCAAIAGWLYGGSSRAERVAQPAFDAGDKVWVRGQLSTDVVPRVVVDVDIAGERYIVTRKDRGFYGIESFHGGRVMPRTHPVPDDPSAGDSEPEKPAPAPRPAMTELAERVRSRVLKAIADHKEYTEGRWIVAVDKVLAAFPWEDQGA